MRKRWIWLLAILAAYGAVHAAVRWHVDEPLRRTIERNVNMRLDGYTVHIRALHLSPLGFSLDLLDSTVTQDAHPDPPVASLPRLSAGVHWRALLHGRLVADFLLDRPTLHINLKQARTEVGSKTPISQRGWQDTLQEIYPLKVNVFTVRDADITYVDEGPFRPLHLSRVNFRAENIRNIRSPEHVYPSDVHLDGVVFDSGTLRLDGQANFLAVPHPGIQGDFGLKHVELGYVEPIVRRYHVSVRNGVFSTDGSFEYAPGSKWADLQQVTAQGVNIEYVHRAQTAADEKRVAKALVQSAKELANHPEIELRVDKVNILNSSFGYADSAKDPAYRLFLTEADIRLANLSNQGAEGTATGTVRGKFMGSGPTQVDVRFRPKASSPDLNVAIRIDGTKMPAINDFLLRYVGFDVADGSFSFYSELTLRDGQVDGYIKPFFRDMQVYDEDKDREKGFFARVRQRLIGAVAWILKNRARDEVATEVHLSGSLESLQFSTWEAVGGLLKNAFVEAIQPGLLAKGGPHGG
jgi:hypothetical protein